MPYQVTLVPNFLVADKFGLLNTRWSIILPGIFSPFSVFLLTKIMRRIPSSYIEAAKLDGASEWQILFHICIPLCKSALFSVALLVFIDYWNMVEQPILFLEKETDYPLSVFLASLNQNAVGIQSVCGLLCLLPVTFFFLYYNTELTDGLKDILWS